MTKTGLIFGCFDLFHYGHAKAINHAKSKCDILCIGVFTDDVIFQYKNKLSAVKFLFRIKLLQELYPDCIIIPIDKRIKLNIDKDIKIFISDEFKDKDTFMFDKSQHDNIEYVNYSKDISSNKIRENVELGINNRFGGYDL